MSEHRHLAFVILSPTPGSNSASTSGSDTFTLTLATVDSIDAAVRLALNLSEQGVNAIELSSAFGDEGLAAVQKAAGKAIPVARVRY